MPLYYARNSWQPPPRRTGGVARPTAGWRTNDA
jgi:hypothetical protein